MLHQRARKLDSGIGRTAVSRALADLVDAGLANVIEARRAQYRYEDATLGPHGHMLDVETGELINVAATELETALSDIARRLGYRLETYRLRLEGRRLAGSTQRDSA